MSASSNPTICRLKNSIGRMGPSELEAALKDVALQISAHLARPTGSSPEFMNDAAGVLESISGDTYADQRITSLFDIAHFFYVAGQAFSGIRPARQAVDLAREIKAISLLRKSLTVLGVCYADAGNVSLAVECYAEAIDCAKSINDKVSEGIVFINLGVALTYAAQYREAIECFEYVLQLEKVEPSLESFRPNALGNIALCGLHLEDFAKGLRAASSSVQDSKEPDTSGAQLSRSLRETYYARLLLESDDLAGAKLRCELARKYAMQSNSPRAEMAASLAEGLYQIRSGNFDIGLSRLLATLERARVVRSMLRDVLSALVKAFDQAGQPERALLYLRELMEVTRATQQENALRHHEIYLDTLNVKAIGASVEEKKLARHEAALKGRVAERELFQTRIEMLERLAVTAELRDDSTGEHSYRVGRLASLLAAAFSCDENTCFMIDLAARLHDIGKIGIPDAILLKPGKLNSAERQLMSSHTIVGAELLSKSKIPHMQMAEEIARFHHEWWNGDGYPSKLSGTAIPLAARITALADVFDALTHSRSYKNAWTADDALTEIRRLRGIQFDPELTDLFVVLVQNLLQEKQDLDGLLGAAARQSPFLQARSKIWDTLFVPTAIASAKFDRDLPGPLQ